MIILSNTSAQTLTAGQSITFNNVILKSRCGNESYRSGTGLVRLRTNGIYELGFQANVTGATAATPVELSIQVSGVTLPETTMIYTPATADAVGNVSADTAIRSECCDYNAVTIVNTGTADITISANASLFIKRLA